jgi:L-threonylcarbamoyladenylate synthase
MQKIESSFSAVVIKVDPLNPQKEAIAQAAEVIRRGGLVAFPTETVYGLGADALNPEAVRRIFEAKGRPLDNPIIVHVADLEHLETLTNEISTQAEALIQRFWPGPLTLIFSKSERVPYEVTGGGDTVAARMPRNEAALALIRAFDGPIAAPSANLSGCPSGTTGEHVLNDFEGKIALILDAGAVEVGVESTVLDISSHPPTILRPGAVTSEQLEEIVGEVVAGKEGRLLKRSPGTRYRHYSPRAEVILIKKQPEAEHLIKQYARLRKRVGLISRYPSSYHNNSRITTKVMPQDLQGYAKEMFAALRELDEQGVDLIIVEEVEEEGIGVAIMDRLRRAAAH